eukprot:CAMPEP_0172016882 /NCGR_PEP_ID=MMETSP1041-20130122/11263_1 /TAXON_ID=464988 /ORGANISM="Hemiselmis andersenii, Strain CCMP439" /LENGTH=111 /DNA_ID=CAMNT_0012671865 /DNA_START=424 /DNA_END=759 /DNA_ORIENTATION=+
MAREASRQAGSKHTSSQASITINFPASRFPGGGLPGGPCGRVVDLPTPSLRAAAAPTVEVVHLGRQTVGVGQASPRGRPRRRVERWGWAGLAHVVDPGEECDRANAARSRQ